MVQIKEFFRRASMTDIIALLCLFSAIALLIALSAIDLKHWILPDELNLALAVCGVVFHVVTAYRFSDIPDMLLGAAIGAGMLYTIRFFANRHYGRDTLGLGDVKLLGAAGLWLGFEATTQAITVGAAAGLVHGIFYAAWLAHRTKQKFNLRGLSIPAGPGFAVGIVCVGIYKFHPYVLEVFHGFAA